MTTIRQSYEAAKYHKKWTIIFFILFSISLFILVFVSQLLSTEKTALDNVSLTVNNMKKDFPQISQDLGSHFTKNNHYLIQIYQHLYLIVLIISFFIFLVYGILSINFRKHEIRSFYYIGVSLFKIVRYLLYELLIPIIVSCSLISLIFIMTQQQITNLSITTNHYVMHHYLDAPQTQSTPSQTDSSSSQTETSDKTLVPYNKNSAFENQAKDQSVSSSYMWFIKSMLALIFMSLLGCLIGFYSYALLNFRHRRIFTL